MGGGSWSASTYAATTGTKIASGNSFSYNKEASQHGFKVHEDLDPTKTNATGLNIRESRDSDEHPNSVPIVITLDSTGSMGSIPATVQKKLAGFMGLLTRHGYVEDPQVAFSVYGDALLDEPAALQFSQFESDNRLDNALDNCVIFGGGGGNGGETASLNFYYTVTHTLTDAWEKRGKRGYYFLIADEVPLEITPRIVQKYVGDGEPLTSLKTEDLAAKLKEKWDVYVLLIDNSSARYQGSHKRYSQLFGEDHVIIVQNAEAISEIIALTLGFGEGMLEDWESASKDLQAVGTRETDVNWAIRSMKNVIKLDAVVKDLVSSTTSELEDSGPVGRI